MKIEEIEHLNALRLEELQLMLPQFPKMARILEIGAGTGRQALALQELGHDVSAVDLQNSLHIDNRVFPVVNYDGKSLPFANESFDMVFSSNVLEHVVDLNGLLAETRRVLTRTGYCVHAMPTPAWRFWTSLTLPLRGALQAWAIRGEMIPRGIGARSIVIAGRGWARFGWRLLQPWKFKPHGERGNAISELVTFGSASWVSVFQRNHFVVLNHAQVGLFYTGSSIIGNGLSIRNRRLLSRWLGSACRFYVTRPRTADE